VEYPGRTRPKKKAL
jgi:hypothetical protein